MQLPPFMQNQKVQIGVIAVAVLIGLIALFTQILGSSSGGDPSAAMSPYGAPGMGPPGSMPGGAPYGAPGMPPGGPGGPPGMMSYGGAPGSDPYGTGAGAGAAT